jgi:hypothetical protein
MNKNIIAFFISFNIFNLSLHAGVADSLVSKTLFRTDMHQAITLGIHNISSMFDKDDNNRPFFTSIGRSDGTAHFVHVGKLGVTHNIGRGLWALLIAEDLAKVPILEDDVNIFEHYAKIAFDNPDNVNGYIESDSIWHVDTHSLREGLLALVALIRYRDSEWAKDKAEKMVKTLVKITDAEGHISEELIGKHCTVKFGKTTDIVGCGRSIEALVEYYRTTRNKMALELAGKYTKACLQTGFTQDGKFIIPNVENAGHIHSYTSTLSGIVLYAIETKNTEILNRCIKIVENGIPEYFSSWGWGDEVDSTHKANVHLRGEINQTGDVVRTALMLAENGYPKYYEMAETYLRNMLLPAQHQACDLYKNFKENKNPIDDSEYMTIKRSIGGYGMNSPNDRFQLNAWTLCALDVTSGAVFALSKCWQNRALVNNRSVHINLLFDYDSDDIQFESHLPLKGQFNFTMKSSKQLWIRIPDWVERGKMKVEVNNTITENHFTTDYNFLVLDGLKGNDKGTISFEIPLKSKKENIEGVDFNTIWIGNQILEIKPRGKYSPIPF